MRGLGPTSLVVKERGQATSDIHFGAAILAAAILVALRRIISAGSS
jgi:hypothetical protein